VFPEIILNCAASADGKIALPDRKKVILSNKEDFERVHRLRTECDAILVGIGTVIEDNPKLTARNSKGKNPTRIILDTNFRIPKDANVFDGESKTIVAVGENTSVKEDKNIEIIKCGFKEVDLLKLLPELKSRGIDKILVEGGETVMWSFLEKKLFDKLYIFISNIVIGGTKTPTIAGGYGSKDVTNILKLEVKNAEIMGNGVLIEYAPKKI
tara:strand:- start:1881 stop:2516 length:636 start_codon:yes stop_codon:yes gene_type:complete